MEIALKIDVDTHEGLAVGVPRLLKTLEAEGVTATFFIAMGPDNSGRAIVRMFKNPGFLAKMRRTRALSMYGLRTVLSGTLLPARPTALACPQIVRDLVRAGFEVGVHGYDHVCWQDHLDELGEARMRAEIMEAFEAYRAILGESARSFAVPGWRTNATALRLFDELRMKYQSNTRGHAPYRCAINREVFVTPEIPTTLPTMDEMMGAPELSDSEAIVDFYLKQFSAITLNVHTIHAETEGMAHLETFKGLLRGLKEGGARFVQLREIASGLATTELPVCELIRTTLPGRAGWVSAQGPEIGGANSSATL
jgi:peptidoglycan/xylan/chitin deacetylase (PgdA/CDA1 family)